jgi:hypothetical protein
MMSAMAGAAAIAGVVAVAAEVRRRLMSRARISRRLAWKHGPKTAHFCFHAPSIMPWMAEDADPA